jgi:hypothetical protein
MRGEEATATINSMQPVTTAPVDAWVAYYGGSGDRMTVYASKFATPTEAETVLGRIRTAFASSSTGYGASKPITAARQNGYKVTGLGEDHFLYVKGAWLIWIQGKARDFPPAVTALVWSRPKN